MVLTNGVAACAVVFDSLTSTVELPIARASLPTPQHNDCEANQLQPNTISILSKRICDSAVPEYICSILEATLWSC